MKLFVEEKQKIQSRDFIDNKERHHPYKVLYKRFPKNYKADSKHALNLKEVWMLLLK